MQAARLEATPVAQVRAHIDLAHRSRLARHAVATREPVLEDVLLEVRSHHLLLVLRTPLGQEQTQLQR